MWTYTSDSTARVGSARLKELRTECGMRVQDVLWRLADASTTSAWTGARRGCGCHFDVAEGTPEVNGTELGLASTAADVAREGKVVVKIVTVVPADPVTVRL